jgi:D-cysteine desulfhydrase
VNGTDVNLPLLARFPALGRSLYRLSLGEWPTPVVDARRFAAAHGLRHLYIKREDLSHPECGGNKVRGLEFLLGEARRRGTRTVITLSAAGSHHVCKTAWHARQFGMDTVAVVVPQRPAAYVRRNLLIGAAAGTRYVPASYLTLFPKLAVEWAADGGNGAGGRRQFIGPGGTTPLACMGHVNAALELSAQVAAGALPQPDYLYVALGSLGTAAGLWVGCQLAGLRTRLVGVVVSYRWYCTAGRWRRIARRIHGLMRRLDDSVPPLAFERGDIHVVGSALGAGYAEPTTEALRLAGQMQELEGIAVDPTYTSKMLHGAMQWIHAGGLHDRAHLLWHTYHPGPLPDEAAAGRLPGALRVYLAAGNDGEAASRGGGTGGA